MTEKKATYYLITHPAYTDSFFLHHYLMDTTLKKGQSITITDTLFYDTIIHVPGYVYDTLRRVVDTLSQLIPVRNRIIIKHEIRNDTLYVYNRTVVDNLVQRVNDLNLKLSAYESTINAEKAAKRGWLFASVTTWLVIIILIILKIMSKVR